MAAPDVRLLDHRDSLTELTSMLHRAYRQLAEMGLRYVATWQDESTTRARIEHGECYGAFVDLQLVGTITFKDSTVTSGSPWYDRPGVSSLGQFGVEPRYQGQRIGGLLMDTVERRARETGAAEIALDTAEPARHLIDWYVRRGYRFIEYANWSETNYRSVILSRRVVA